MWLACANGTAKCCTPQCHPSQFSTTLIQVKRWQNLSRPQPDAPKNEQSPRHLSGRAAGVCPRVSKHTTEPRRSLPYVPQPLPTANVFKAARLSAGCCVLCLAMHSQEASTLRNSYVQYSSRAPPPPSPLSTPADTLHTEA